MTNAYTHRYALCAVIGLAVVPLALYRLEGRRTVVGAGVAATLAVAFVVVFVPREQNASRLSADQQGTVRFLEEHAGIGTPILIDNPHAFLELSQVAPPRLARRFLYIADPEWESIQRGLPHVGRIASAPRVRAEGRRRRAPGVPARVLREPRSNMVGSAVLERPAPASIRGTDGSPGERCSATGLSTRSRPRAQAGSTDRRSRCAELPRHPAGDGKRRDARASGAGPDDGVASSDDDGGSDDEERDAASRGDRRGHRRARRGLLAELLALLVLKIWKADLDVPFAYSWDANQFAMYTKEILHGWYYRNGHLGAPFGQQLTTTRTSRRISCRRC